MAVTAVALRSRTPRNLLDRNRTARRHGKGCRRRIRWPVWSPPGVNPQYALSQHMAAAAMMGKSPHPMGFPSHSFVAPHGGFPGGPGGFGPSAFSPPTPMSFPFGPRGPMGALVGGMGCRGRPAGWAQALADPADPEGTRRSASALAVRSRDPLSPDLRPSDESRARYESLTPTRRRR